MVFSLLYIIILLWFIRTIKFVLFWIYLWQLKNYHVGRFVDHFRTHKGRKIFFNSLFIVKLVLLVLLFIHYDASFYILLLVYAAESFIFIANILKRTVKVPKFTSKTVFLGTMAFLDVTLYLYFLYSYAANPFWIVILMLAYDILIPVIVSLIVLFFQPFFVAARNRILQKAAKKMTQFPGLKVIAITGSYGKTSTKEFLTTILSSKFKVLATPDHNNSEIGIAQTILRDLKPEHEIFVVEMGAYNKGGIKLLCDIVEPEMGVVTGVNEQHLATFGSLENLLSAEGGRELLASLPPHGTIIVNGDNEYCLDLYKTAAIKKRLYAVKKNVLDSHIWTEDVTVNTDSISFIAVSGQANFIDDPNKSKKEMAHFAASVLGRQQVQNLLGAILAARELGMNFGEISNACGAITQAQAGMTLKKGAYGLEVIDATYSSNSDGVAADLDYLKIFPGKCVIVMPCLIELGNKSSQVHYQIGKKIAEVCDLAIITTKDQFEQIKKGAIENGMAADKVIFSEKPKEIFSTITTSCKQGDTVLIEGGRPKELIRLLHGKYA